MNRPADFSKLALVLLASSPASRPDVGGVNTIVHIVIVIKIGPRAELFPPPSFPSTSTLPPLTAPFYDQDLELSISPAMEGLGAFPVKGRCPVIVACNSSLLTCTLLPCLPTLSLFSPFLNAEIRARCSSFLFLGILLSRMLSEISISAQFFWTGP